MSKNVVGLIAAKGAGKDTLAGFLKAFGYRRMAFADALYAEAAEAYGTTVEALQVRETKETPQACLAPVNCKIPEFAEYCVTWLTAQDNRDNLVLGYHYAAMSPREVLQLWGTWRRETVSPRYWLDQVVKKIDAMPDGSKVVITDVRYSNEADVVSAIGGVLVRILNTQAEKAAMPDTHPSETELRSRQCHLAIDNNGNLAEFEARASAFAGKLALLFGHPERESVLAEAGMTEELLHRYFKWQGATTAAA